MKQKIPLFLWNGRNRVEQNPISKLRENLRFRTVLRVLHLKIITKNAKNGDKTLSGIPSFLLAKFAGSIALACHLSFSTHLPQK